MPARRGYGTRCCVACGSTRPRSYIFSGATSQQILVGVHPGTAPGPIAHRAVARRDVEVLVVGEVDRAPRVRLVSVIDDERTARKAAPAIVPRVAQSLRPLKVAWGSRSPGRGTLAVRGLAVTEPKREIIDNQERDLEAEAAEELPPRRTPWDPKKIRVTTKPWSLRQAVDDIDEGTIDLAPDFQRRSIWKAAQRSRLIESVLLGIPLPAFYFNASADGRMQVVDGVQRLSAIRDFAKNHLPLVELEYLTLLAGQTFQVLDASWRRRFHQTQILVHVIEPETPVEVKLDIFKRINTGGEPLKPQEIRHAISLPRSRDLLKRMSQSDLFRRATGNAFDDDPRMADRELALRFVALRLDPDLSAYEQADTVDAYLMGVTRRLDDPAQLSDDQLAELGGAFDRAMQAAELLFGEYAFRKWPISSERRSPLNRALFESWSVALAEYPPEQLAPRKDAIVEAARTAFTSNKDYLASVTAGTADLGRVRLRLELARNILKTAGV